MPEDGTQQDPGAPRRQRWADLYGKYIEPSSGMYNYGPSGEPLSEKRKARFARRIHKGDFGRTLRRFQLLREMNPMYSEPENALRDYSAENLAAAREGGGTTMPGLDLRRESSPVLGEVSRYVRERLGTGLTPEEASAMRGENIEAVEGAASEGKRTMANTFAASGMDPRASLAALGRLERGREQGRAGVERFVTEKGLERKGAIEDLASRTAAEEETGRRFDVGATLGRLKEIEGLQAWLANQAEGRREYDLGFVESRRQARLARELMDRMRRQAEPSGMEEAGAILGGIRGGLSMGG